MSDSIVESNFFKITTYPRINVFDKLPGLQGVQTLTKYEIRKDLRDIERSFFVDDTDSDSSVKSEDILTSSYPVKPRRTHRLSLRNDTKDRLFLDVDKDRATIAAADDALNFLRAIKVSKVDLFNAEMERERLEALQASYERSIQEKSEKYAAIRKEQENYLQLMQAIYTKYLRQNIAYCRQNLMIFDIIETMQRRRQAAEILDTESKKLKAALQGKGTKVSSNSKQSLIEGETAMLRVHLQKANKEVVLYKGQWLKTPMGIGQIISIQPGEHRVVIMLPFGKMYSYLERVVCWGGASDVLDATSDKSLCVSWTTSKFMNMPIEKRIGIRNLLGRLEENDDFTDQDDDNSTDPMQTTELSILSPSIDENSAMQVLQSALSQDTKTMDVLAAEVAESEADNAISDRLLASVGLDFMNGGKKIFPLQTNASSQSGENGRLKIRKSLFDDILSDSVDIRDLPFAFAPPAVVPDLVERLEDPKKEYRVEICKQALQSSDHGKMGTTGALAWSGNTEDMNKKMQASHKGITKLESEVNDFMRVAQSSTARSLKTMKEVSSIRLAMFTKRIRHRNSVGNHASLSVLNPNSATVKDELSNGIVKKDSTDKSSSSSSTSPVREIEAATSSTSKKRARESIDGNGSKKSTGVNVKSEGQESYTKTADVVISKPLHEVANSQESVMGENADVDENENKSKKSNKRAKK